jgi:hypothetical protein
MRRPPFSNQQWTSHPAVLVVALLAALAIVGPDDHADAQVTEAMRAEFQARRPVLVGQELRGCAPDVTRMRQSGLNQQCARWAIYDDGTEVLTGIVSVRSGPASVAAAPVVSAQGVLP